MKTTKIAAVLMIVGMVGIGVLYAPKSAGAAPRVSPLVLSPTLEDDPHINSDTSSPTLSMSGVTLQAPLSGTSTNNDDSTVGNDVHGYTWRVTMPSICEGAQITGIRIATNTTASAESPISGLLLAVYGTQDLTMFDQYTVAEGEDGENWLAPLYSMSTPVVTRGVGDGAYFPADLGVAGTLDATWDITSYTSGEPLGVYIQHWLGGTTVLQTVIETAELLYDDAGCASPTDSGDQDGGAVSAGSGSAPTLANTGDSVIALSAIIAGLVLTASFGVMKSARRDT